MSTARRAARALVAVSTFLRAPWGVSLALKSTLTARPRALLSGYNRQRSHLLHSSCGSTRSLKGGDEAALLLETAGVEAGESATDLREMGVGESEVLSREAWTARAEAHRTRYVCTAVSTCSVWCLARLPGVCPRTHLNGGNPTSIPATTTAFDGT